MRILNGSSFVLTFGISLGVADFPLHEETVLSHENTEEDMRLRQKPATIRRPDANGPRPRRMGLAAATAAVALLAAACGGSDDATEASSDGGAETESAASNGPVLDPSLFSGEAQTIGGESFDLGSLADKDLVLWFWAPW